MNDKIADFGERWLLENYDKSRLEIEYNNDMERVFIQLKDTQTGSCTVFDADNIFAQVHEFVSKKHDDVTTYVIHMGDECYKGSAQDCARWYCNHKGIKLFIEPDAEDTLTLYAQIGNDKVLTLIAYFENGDNDIETTYKLFFTEFLLEQENPDYAIAELS